PQHQNPVRGRLRSADAQLAADSWPESQRITMLEAYAAVVALFSSDPRFPSVSRVRLPAGIQLEFFYLGLHH
ncbi:MAG TPA: hypothetical protein VFS81_02645, partial [Candidatus Binatia bacterium]|nr:hypothetical protein [Candidatus Binatia bacterium]